MKRRGPRGRESGWHQGAENQPQLAASKGAGLGPKTEDHLRQLESWEGNPEPEMTTQSCPTQGCQPKGLRGAPNGAVLGLLTYRICKTVQG